MAFLSWEPIVAMLVLLAASAAETQEQAPVSSTPAAAEASPEEDSAAEANARDKATNAPLRMLGAPESDAAGPDADGRAPDHDNGDIPARMTTEDLYERVKANSDSEWAIGTFLLVLLVVQIPQTGFSLLERGHASDQLAGSTWERNISIVPLAALAFWVYGFAIGWGNWWNGPVPPGYVAALGPGLTCLNGGIGIGPTVDAAGDPTGGYTWGLLGTKGFFLRGVHDASVFSLFTMMLPFLITALTIPGGAMAQRWNLKSVFFYPLWATLAYCLYGNWVWGGGWLAQAGVNWSLGHGAVDFAGSAVVHAMGGMIALAGCIAIGPRDQQSRQSAPQTVPVRKAAALILGTFLLAICWAGWDLREALTQTAFLAGVAGAIGALCTSMLIRRKLTPTAVCQGLLAGIVASSASCVFIDRLAAATIGAVAGVLAVLSLRYWERLGIDDVTGAISVNGVGGLWGLIAVGLFANGQYGPGWNGLERNEWVQRAGSDGVRGLLYGDASQLWAQLLAAAVVIVFGFGIAYTSFRISDRFISLRIVPLAALERAADTA